MLVLMPNAPINIHHGGEVLTVSLRHDGRLTFDGPRSFVILRQNAQVRQPRTQEPSEFRVLPEDTKETSDVRAEISDDAENSEPATVR